jgi:hypothetical protein
MRRQFFGSHTLDNVLSVALRWAKYSAPRSKSDRTSRIPTGAHSQKAAAGLQSANRSHFLRLPPESAWLLFLGLRL